MHISKRLISDEIPIIPPNATLEDIRWKGTVSEFFEDAIRRIEKETDNAHSEKT